MREATRRMIAADRRAGFDRILYSDETAHIMVVELMIELERKKREVSKLEAKVKWQEVQRQRMTNGRGR